MKINKLQRLPEILLENCASTHINFEKVLEKYEIC